MSDESPAPLSPEITKTIKKSVPRPRKWNKKWVKVGHMQLLKWIPGLYTITIHCFLF